MATRPRRRIRWDRIAVAAIVLILLIFLLGSCMQSCADKRERQKPLSVSSQTDPAQTQITEAAVTTAPNGLVNLPVIITDGTQSPTITTSVTAGTDTTEPAYTLPAGYEETRVEPSLLYSGTLVLVDKSHPSHLNADELDLEQVYYAADKPETYEISYPGHTSLNQTALAKFNRLMKAYYAATNNTEIMFNYGYLEDGKEKSNQESSTGLDVQIHLKKDDGSYNFVTNDPPYSWLFEHMESYGFIQRYPADKAEITGDKGGYTALRYVGVPHAAYMKEYNLCLEEYLDMLRGSHDFYNGTVLGYTNAGVTYRIYYVPVSADGSFTVPVPTSGSYEISGNNVDGFIVTAIVG